MADCLSKSHESSSPDSSGLVELWRRSEFLKFEQYLQQLEEAKQQSVKDELLRLKRTEQRMKQKLLELERKERELTAVELDLKRAKDESVGKAKRAAEDHQAAIHSIKEQHMIALKIEKDKLRAEEAKRRSLEIELAKKAEVGKPNGVKKREISHPTITSLNTTAPVNAPVASSSLDEGAAVKVRMLEWELQQLKEREILVRKSRDHFRAAVIQLTRQLWHAGPVGDGGAMDRLLAKREELIQSGIYCETDDVITQIDSRLNSQQTVPYMFY